MIIYRLEKDGFGPAAHPRHGWKFVYREIGTRRRLWRHFPGARDSRWMARREPEGSLDVLFERLYRRHARLGEYHSVLMRRLRRSLRFGCPSKRQLIGFWGREFYELCTKMGFRIVEYKVSKKNLFFDKSGRQCAFLLKDARRLSAR